MNQQDETYLGGVRRSCQHRQEISGVLTPILAFLTFFAFLSFLLAPAGGTATVLGCLSVLLFAVCARLIGSAARVVEIDNLLARKAVEAPVIEAEVMDGDGWRS